MTRFGYLSRQHPRRGIGSVSVIACEPGERTSIVTQLFFNIEQTEIIGALLLLELLFQALLTVARLEGVLISSAAGVAPVCQVLNSSTNSLSAVQNAYAGRK